MPVSYTHLDVYKRQAMAVEQEKRYVHVESKFQEGRLLLSIKNSKPSGTSSCQQTCLLYTSIRETVPKTVWSNDYLRELWDENAKYLKSLTRFARSMISQHSSALWRPFGCTGHEPLLPLCGRGRLSRSPWPPVAAATTRAVDRGFW